MLKIYFNFLNKYFKKYPKLIIIIPFIQTILLTGILILIFNLSKVKVDELIIFSSFIIATLYVIIIHLFFVISIYKKNKAETEIIMEKAVLKFEEYEELLNKNKKVIVNDVLSKIKIFLGDESTNSKIQ